MPRRAGLPWPLQGGLALRQSLRRSVNVPGAASHREVAAYKLRWARPRPCKVAASRAGRALSAPELSR